MDKYFLSTYKSLALIPRTTKRKSHRNKAEKNQFKSNSILMPNFITKKLDYI